MHYLGLNYTKIVSPDTLSRGPAPLLHTLFEKTGTGEKKKMKIS
jgi:hypothetical protein